MEQTRYVNLPVIRKNTTWRTSISRKWKKKSKGARSFHSKSSRSIYARIFTEIRPNV